ncbi:MAG: hypothetical protein CVU44_20175 [Chloroflexi bacterium HGW-Chloroflexi-6]|nr:MAG: hypothetical protein CVU44_20175 [Chloroflexi bacterium HGW-Chloroflexi-6]
MNPPPFLIQRACAFTIRIGRNSASQGDYMKALKAQFSRIVEQALPWAVLAVLLLYTYVKFIEAPYIGFRWASSSEVVILFTNGDNLKPIQLGDRLLQADSVTWTEYKEDLSKPFVSHAQPGQVIQLRIERDGNEIVIPWIVPGPSFNEISDRIWSEGLLGYAFWFFGTLTFLVIRPRNERWRLLVAFNFLTAIWLTIGGGVSYLHLWGSLIAMRAFVWLSIPVYLHLHWVFPKPLAKLSPRIIWIVYSLAALLAAAELFQLFQTNFYYLGFILSIVGSLLFLLLHAIRQSEERKLLRTLFLSALLSFAPSIVLGLLKNFIELPYPSDGLGLLSLPLLPLAYFYVVARRQLGGLELRFNQALAVYIYTIILLLVLLPVIGVLNLWIFGPGSAIIISALMLIISALLTLFSYRYVQAFVEHIILGVSLPPRDLLELYSERITTSTSLLSLQTILADEILPRLHIRQFAFLQVEKGTPQVLQTVGIVNLPVQNALLLTDQLAGKYRTPETADPTDPFAWVHLAVELTIGGEQVGLWLFGRRDPDDFYSQPEINLIQILANQTAVALSNIVQTQRISEMYQQDISRHENERMRLALELHDSILNQLATMLLRLDDKSISPQFQEAYDELIDRLREIVSNLRPPMLSYGLKPALDELAESLIEQDKNGLVFTLDLQSEGCRYPAEVEQHLFRIVQEACENALRHGLARNITITGELQPNKINLTITDNGRGFDTGKGFSLATLLTNKHFGLAGMLERAEMIGGDVKIESSPETGTQVRFQWASLI